MLWACAGTPAWWPCLDDHIPEASPLTLLRPVTASLHGGPSTRYYHCLCRHPRVVACLDLIEVDNNSFASILELCPGGDLDSHLQEHQVKLQSLQCRTS